MDLVSMLKENLNDTMKLYFDNQKDILRDRLRVDLEVMLENAFKGWNKDMSSFISRAVQGALDNLETVEYPKDHLKVRGPEDEEEEEGEEVAVHQVEDDQEDLEVQHIEMPEQIQDDQEDPFLNFNDDHPLEEHSLEQDLIHQNESLVLYHDQAGPSTSNGIGYHHHHQQQQHQVEEEYINLDHDDSNCNCSECLDPADLEPQIDLEEYDAEAANQGGSSLLFQNGSASASAEESSAPGPSSSRSSRKRKVSLELVEPKTAPIYEGIMITAGIRCTFPDCEVICQSKGDLDGHLKVVHRIMPYQCWLSGCGRFFQDTSKLTTHINQDHATVTSWLCLRCSQNHDSSHRLNQHYLNAHFKRVYRCATQSCPFTANLRREMYRHYMSFHKQNFARNSAERGSFGPQKFTCPYPSCGKQFTERCNLRTHKRFHMRIKPFSCIWEGCHYTSEDRANTVRHIRVRHLRLPPTLKEQQEKGIVNEIDPRQWLNVASNLLSEGL